MQNGFNNEWAQFSPDGHWIAYQSNETQLFEIYVAAFPGPGGTRQISMGGGARPRWNPNGKELFFITQDQQLMAAEIDRRGDSPEVNAVKHLFGPINTTGGFFYDVSADEQHFLAGSADRRSDYAGTELGART